MIEGTRSRASARRSSMAAGWTAVAIFTLLYVVAYLDRQVINLLTDDIRHSLRLSAVQMSLLQGPAFVFSFALCGLPIGWAIDRYPRRWIVFIGVVVWSLAASGAGLARSYGELLTARLGVGAGESALQPSAYSIFADLFPKDRLSLPLGVFSVGAIAGMGASLVLGGMIVGWARAQGTIILPMLGVLEPWQLVMLVTGIPGLLVSALAFLITEPARDAPTKEVTALKPRLWDQLKRHRTFYICHFVGFSALGALAQGWNAWSPAFLGRTLGWQTPQIGATLGILTMIGGFTGQLGGAAVADLLFRRGMRDAHLRVYAFGGLVAGSSGVTATLAATAGAIWLMFGAIIVLYAAISFLAVAAAALQIATPATMRGRMSTLFLMIYNIVGYGVGPVAVASIAQYAFTGDNLGMGLVWNFAIFGTLSALILFLGLKAYRGTIDEDPAAPA